MQKKRFVFIYNSTANHERITGLILIIKSLLIYGKYTIKKLVNFSNNSI